MPSSRAVARAHEIAGAVERLGARGGLLGRAEHRPLLGQHDQVGAGARGLARQPVRGLEVALAIGRGLQLDGGGAHLSPVD